MDDDDGDGCRRHGGVLGGGLCDYVSYVVYISMYNILYISYTCER